MKKLPIGIQTFADLIGGNYLYVDKTREILELITSGKYFFLSRPRRFGKSLLISTLKEIFSGNQGLFQGLYIYDKIEWESCPVIHLDFSLLQRDNADSLRAALLRKIHEIASDYGLTLDGKSYSMVFAQLIAKLAGASQQKVVIVIDEYDKPMIDFVDNLEIAKENREVLKPFYEIIKGSDQYIRFALLTGVSKFSRVSVFSGLNNLQDITLSSKFATLLGYTQEELERYFEAYLRQFCEEEGLERTALLDDIRSWYNGYSWNAEDRVYNPFSVLNLFANRRFANYWFASGTPTFLTKLVKDVKIDVAEFEEKPVPEIAFDSYDLENMNVFSLLFQAGYLTITRIERRRTFWQYTLNYPNQEVKEAFLTYVFESFTENRRDEIPLVVEQLRESLEEGNIAEFMTTLQAIFARIPYTLHLPKEAYYHSLFYMVCALMGVDIDLEVLTDKGRIDGVLELAHAVYLLEFKYGQPGTTMETLAEAAIRQIEQKAYDERFAHDPRQRFLLGVGFLEKEIGYKLVTAS